MLGALANGIDVLVVAAGEVVVDHDPLLNLKTGLLGQVNVGTDSGGQDHHVAVQLLPVTEADPGHPSVSGNGGGHLSQVNVDAQVFHLLLEHPARLGVKLGVHQVRVQVGDVDFQPLTHQAAGGFQPQQAAPDDHGLACPGGIAGHHLAVLQGAEDENAVDEPAVLVVQVGHGRNVGPASGGNHQLVVGLGDAPRRVDRLAEAVNPAGPHSRVELDAVLLVPVHRVDENVRRSVGSGQDAGQEHPVVVAVALFAEHHDFELFGPAPGDDFLDEPASGHAVADNYQALLCCFPSGAARREIPTGSLGHGWPPIPRFRFLAGRHLTGQGASAPRRP